LNESGLFTIFLKKMGRIDKKRKIEVGTHVGNPIFILNKSGLFTIFLKKMGK